jgi:hypothetical protein
MANDTVEGVRRERFVDLLSELSGSVLVTTSTSEDVAGLVASLESGTAGDVRVLVDEAAAKAVRDSFLLSSRIVDLIDDDVLAVRVDDPDPRFSMLLVGEDEIRSLASIGGDAVTELRGDDDASVERLREAFEDRWADAEPFSVRTPAYSRMLASLDERLGGSMRADVEQVFEEATGVRGEAGTIQPVRLSLLMGAKNEVQFYELGLWGESEGVASRAKFSREKQTLEEQGLIDTEKVPTDVGRPRQRLVLTERLEGMDPLELLSTVRSVLPD